MDNSISFSRRLESRANNFDLLRLVAAVGVLVSHAFPLTSGDNSTEPLFRLSGGAFTLGQFCVAVFFIISGALITQSANRARDLGQYGWARVLRIWPGLIVALVATVGVLGPLMTPDPLATYLLRPSTYAYIIRNATLIHPQYSLGHLFEQNPFPGAVNGSLWTLSYEVGFYILVAALVRIGACRPLVVLPLWLLAAASLPGKHVRAYRSRAMGPAIPVFR